MGDVFYIVGIGLTLAALALSFIGLRAERFPPSRAAFAALLGFMGALVVATCAFAVVLAREEREHRAEEATATAEEDATAEEEAPDQGPEAPPGGGKVEEEPASPKPVELTSPADGSLVFEPDSLQAPAGVVEIAYTNPSPVPHNVAIEGDGAALTGSETVTGGDTATASAELEPGEYVFYCAIPGHREAGMEGTLTVD